MQPFFAANMCDAAGVNRLQVPAADSVLGELQLIREPRPRRPPHAADSDIGPVDFWVR
jgi:hypothetical protein